MSLWWSETPALSLFHYLWFWNPAKCPGKALGGSICPQGSCDAQADKTDVVWIAKVLTKGLYKTPLYLNSPIEEHAGQLGVVLTPPWLSLVSLFLHNVSPGPPELRLLCPEFCAHPKSLTMPLPDFWLSWQFYHTQKKNCTEGNEN